MLIFLNGVLAGVTRAVVLELCEKLSLPVQEIAVTPDELRQAEGVFLTLSTQGVVEAAVLDGNALSQSPLVGKLRSAFVELTEGETSGQVIEKQNQS